MFKIYSILDTISTRKDRSIKLVFETNEITPEQGAEMMKLVNMGGWLLFAERSEELEVPLEELPESLDETKSPSQRLRGVLYAFWVQQGSKGTFNESYRRYIEKQIETIKEKLE